MHKDSLQRAAESTDQNGMNLSRIGISAYQNALGNFSRSAERVATKGPEVDDIVSMKEAEQSAKIGLQIAKRGFEVEESLLDILA